jgi:ribosomal protein L11 methyltransferase
MLAAPLIELAPRLVELLIPAVKLLVSGILADHVAPVTAAYTQWMDFDVAQLSEEWTCISGTMKEE